MDRKRLAKVNKAFADFQRKYRKRRSKEEKQKQLKMAKSELQFQLVLEHRRKQRARKVEMLELLEILPAHKIEGYLEKQREYSATVIQANWRGYRARRMFEERRGEVVRDRAAVKIQREV